MLQVAGPHGLLNNERWLTARIELDQEDDGRWIAEVPDLPGVMTYGATRDDVARNAKALALRVTTETKWGLVCLHELRDTRTCPETTSDKPRLLRLLLAEKWTRQPCIRLATYTPPLPEASS